MRQISVQEALALSKEEAVLVDVRQEEEFSRGSIPGAINIPAEELEDHAELWKQDKTVYLFCHTGRKSAECVQDLEKEGKNVVDVEGGYRSYLRYSLSQFTKQEENLGERTAQIERSLIKKFRKPIWRRFTKAIKEYELIQEGDKIAVCISGGKDSMLLAKLIQEIKKQCPLFHIAVDGSQRFFLRHDRLQRLVCRDARHDLTFEMPHPLPARSGVFRAQFTQPLFESGIQLDFPLRKSFTRRFSERFCKIAFFHPFTFRLMFLSLIPAVAVRPAGSQRILPHEVGHAARLAHRVVKAAQRRR